jgi:hypothetical protein
METLSYIIRGCGVLSPHDTVLSLFNDVSRLPTRQRSRSARDAGRGGLGLDCLQQSPYPMLHLHFEAKKSYCSSSSSSRWCICICKMSKHPGRTAFLGVLHSNPGMQIYRRPDVGFRPVNPPVSSTCACPTAASHSHLLPRPLPHMHPRGF